LKNIVLILAIVLLFVMELILGPVGLAPGEVLDALTGQASQIQHLIVVETRLPRALTAVLAGLMLSLSGLLMQTLFRNPLAGPSVMGISSGASLGVALVVMLGSFGMAGSGMAANTLIAAAGIAGAMLVLLLVLAVSKRIPDNTTLLIFGIMVSFFTSAVVDAIQFKATNESLRSYVNWGMGSFAETGSQQIILMTALLALCLIVILYAGKRLNPMLLGDEYAMSMGVAVKPTRMMLLAVTGIMAGITTAFCGPVAFIGLAVPHLMRSWLGTSDHRTILLPVALAGAAFGLLCDLISRMSDLPLNTIASAFGAPVVLWIILKGQKNQNLI
jgi:iron complex transport system permease protein